MDDLYANAWGDSADPPLPALKPSTSSGSSWLSPSLSNPHEEDDLAAPSWSTGSGISWDEPSDSAGFSWAQADTDLAWGSSAYDNIKIGKSIPVHDGPHVAEDHGMDAREAEEQEVDERIAEEQGSLPDVDVYEDAREFPSLTGEQALPSEAPLADVEILVPPADNDAFGTFESALIPDQDAAVALEEGDLDADAWGSAWAHGSETSDAQETKPADEWEAARQRKAQQDRRVPPEVTAGLLRDTEKFCGDTWPDTSDAVETDKWKDTWRRGIEGVEGLEALVNTFLPPLSLQPPVYFGKTSTGKHMASAVRQTKNLAMSKRSPMAYYLAAKGSTAWELAVKERKDSATDDLPAGWRILEKDATKDTTTNAAKDKKPAGRLFSFWGRRESNNAHSRSPSLSDVKAEPSLSPTMSEQAEHSRRPSQDSVISFGGSGADKNTSPTTQYSSSLASVNLSTASTASAPSRPTSYADAPELHGDPDNVQAPSAVSRFLNRFSRGRSTTGSGSPRNTLALSSDDLEFLSEIPSANDVEDDEEANMNAFESVFNSGPRPSVLPPPLPPPLLPPPPVNTDSRNASSQATSSLHSPMDSVDSSLGLLDSTSFTAAFVAVAPSSGTALSRPVIAIPVLQPSRPSTPPVPLPRKDTRSASPSPSPLSVERKATPTQPFFLPSPPSSRSHTPIPAVRSSLSGAARSQTPPVRQEASSSRSPPPPFPPPRAHAFVSDGPVNPPDTPTSSMPLAHLYPDAYRAQADKATTSRPASRPQVSAPFMPPPLAPSQSSTALPPLLAPPPPPLKPTLPPLLPPPAPSRQSSVPPIPPLAAPRQSTMTPPPSLPAKPSAPPKPALSLDLHGAVDKDDDEEFSDFLSSATVPTSSKALVRSFSTSSRTSTPGKATSTGLGRTGGRPPPLAHFRIGSATSQRSVSGTPPLPAKPSLLDDTDDFSDFQESPATSHPQSSKPFKDYFGDDFRSPVSVQPLQSLPSYSSSESMDGGANSSLASDKAFVTPMRDLGFDFLGSYTSSLNTPSPPRPISKTSHAPLASSSSSQPTRSVSNASSSRASKAASHLHTLNLMEKAASHPGRWPAPLSPLPPTIPGPGWNPLSTASADLLGDDGSPKAGSVTASQSTSLMDPFGPAAIGSGNGNPLVLPGPSLLQQSSQSLQSLALGSVHRMGTPPVAHQPAMAPAVNTKRSVPETSGLSAQDLMFFEGL